MSDAASFTHILRVLNTNIDGKEHVMYGLTAVKGVGRRFANLVCKKADISLAKRAGELSPDDVEKYLIFPSFLPSFLPSYI